MHLLKLTPSTLCRRIALLKDFANDNFQYKPYNNRFFSKQQFQMLKALNKLSTNRTEEQIIELIQTKGFPK